MKAEELLKLGDLDGALKHLQMEVRGKPADYKLRIFLFQILSVLGQWDRAITQLNVAADMDPDPESKLMAQQCRPALNCEVFRDEVFNGKRSPMIFGEPAEWVAWITQAIKLLAEGNLEAAAEMRNKAFDAAPETQGSITFETAESEEPIEETFTWIADADTRIGPMLEAIIGEKYYWIPFVNIKEIVIEKPQDLRDMVWVPAYVTWTNEGQNVALIPTRYAGTEKCENAALRLSKTTEWKELGEQFYQGIGERNFSTDHNEYRLLQTRKITLT